MKYIKIFLASSIREFSKERLELESYINKLNTIYIRKGLFFELVVCEGLSNALALERKQEEYNQEIRDSQYFYVLFGKEAGSYTVEEFDVALDAFRNQGAPKIYTYFQGLPEEEQEESVKQFMQRLDKELGHYYSFFEHLDSIKLNLLLELARDSQKEGEVRFEDGKALLDGKEVLSLEQVPVYGKNDELQKMREEINALQREIADLAAAYSENPGDRHIREELAGKSGRYQEITKKFSEAEEQVLKLCSMIAERNSSGEPMTFREKEAGRLLHAGDYKGALAVLRLSGRKEEIEQIRSRKARMEQEVTALIHETRLRVQTLLIGNLTKERMEECIDCYEEAVALSEEFQVERDILLEYVIFLSLHHKIKEGLESAKRLEEQYEKNGTTKENIRLLYDLFGKLYLGINDFGSAEKYYRDALHITESMETELARDEYRKDLALHYNALAGTIMHMGKQHEAEELFCRAVEIQKEYAGEDKLDKSLGLADMYNNLGLLMKQMNRYPEAEENYVKALGIYNDIQTAHTDIPFIMHEELALLYYNLGNLLAEQKRRDEAEQYYKKADELIRQILDKNPAAYETMLFMIQASMGTLYLEMNQPEKAERCLAEAYEGYEKYAKEDILAFGKELIDVSYSYASLQWGWKKRYGKVRKLYRNIICLYEALAGEDKEKYDAEIAKTKSLLAEMFREQGHLKRAETEYEELIPIYQRLAAGNKQRYEPELSAVYFNLAVIALTEDKNVSKTRRFMEKSLEICEKYPHLGKKAGEIRRFLA